MEWQSQSSKWLDTGGSGGSDSGGQGPLQTISRRNWATKILRYDLDSQGGFSSTDMLDKKRRKARLFW